MNQLTKADCRWLRTKVGFEDYDEDVEEVEVEKTPKRKVHGRTPTAFVPKKASADVGNLRFGMGSIERQSDGTPLLQKVG